MKRKISRRKFLKQTAFAGAALPLASSKLAINAKTSVAANPSRQPLVLWYEKPAEQWVEALPIGSGRLGAMIFGGTTSERLQINEGAPDFRRTGRLVVGRERSSDVGL